MRRIVALLSLVALGAAAAAQAQGELPVPELLRVASRLTGIPTANAKAKPKVVVLSPAALQSRAVKEAVARYPAAVLSYDTELYRALGLLGPAQKLQPLVAAAWVRRGEPVLDARTRTVYVARGADARGAALAGLVQALYADRYGLARTFAQDSDGSLALAAAARGASDLAVRNLRSAAAAPTPSTQASAFLGLEAQFVDAVGLRLVSNLFNVGGDTAVRSLLARPPVSTEQVLHVDKYLAHESPSPMELPADAAGFSLVRDDTFGELDVRALLAVYQVPRLDRVGSGWGGGMSAVYRSAVGDAVALRLDWDTPVDAAEWAEAVGTYTWRIAAKAGTRIVKLRMPKQVRRPGLYTIVWSASSQAQIVRHTQKVKIVGVVKGRPVVVPQKPVEVVLAGDPRTRDKLALGIGTPKAKLQAVTSVEDTFALAGNTSRNVQVVVVDVDRYGMTFLRDLRTVFPSIRLVAVSSSPRALSQARRVGANAALPRKSTRATIARTIRRLAGLQ